LPLWRKKEAAGHVATRARFARGSNSKQHTRDKPPATLALFKAVSMLSKNPAFAGRPFLPRTLTKLLGAGLFVLRLCPAQLVLSQPSSPGKAAACQQINLRP